MSIVLKDGTVLPDLPERVLADAPYVIVTALEGVPMALAASQPFVCLPKSLHNLAVDYDVLGIQPGIYAVYVYENSDWASYSSESPTQLGGLPDASVYDLAQWVNHDILFVDTYDSITRTYTIGTEVAIPSNVKSSFILPDGTELPALPDGCFEGTPYGSIFSEDGVYVLSVASLPSFAAPAAISPNDATEYAAHMDQPGRSKGWYMFADEWTLLADETYTFPTVLAEELDERTLWVNHDILTATTKNADGSYTIGTEIARKSDENYRVTGGYMTSIANEARRLGGKTGGMLPAVTEETLRGVTGGEPELQEKTVTPTSAVQVVVPDEGYDGLSKVTVEAASGGGGSMFQTSASGRIPVYESGTAESVLDADDVSFTTSAVGALK